MGNWQPVASGQRRGIQSRRVERSSGEARQSRMKEWKRHTVCLLHKAQEYKGKWEKCLRKSTAQQRFERGNCCKDSASQMVINLSQMSAGRWRGGRSKTRKSAERRCNGLVERQTQPTSSTTRTPNLIETSKEPCQGSKAARQQQRQHFATSINLLKTTSAAQAWSLKLNAGSVALGSPRGASLGGAQTACAVAARPSLSLSRTSRCTERNENIS